LENLGRLSAADPVPFARDEWACARAFDLEILGGCCGTDDRDIEAIAALAAAF
jgi:methionine synthase I (cobalamin-dependent)